MRHTVKHLLTAAVAWFCRDASAQVVFRNAEEVFAYAEQRNAALLADRCEAGIARLSTRQSKGAMWPSVALNGSFTDNLTLQPTLVPSVIFNPAAPNDAVSEVVFGKQYLYNANVTAQWELLDMENLADLKIAPTNEAVQKAAAGIAKSRLYTDLAAAFAAIVLTQENIRLCHENVEAAQAIEQAATDKFEKGLVAEPPLNLAKANRLRAEQTLSQHSASLAIQRNNLAMLLHATDSVAVEYDLSGQTAQASTAPPVGNGSAVELAVLRVRMAELQVGKAKSAAYPKLSAVYQYSTQIASDDFLRFGSSHTLPQQYIGLKLSVPLFAGLRNKHEIEKHRQNLLSSRFAYSAQQREQTLRNDNLWLNFQQAKAKLSADGAVLKLYAANEQHHARLMNAGLLDVETRLRHHSDYLAQQGRWLQSVGEALVAQLNIQVQNINH